MALRPPNPNETLPRYTTVAEVKERLTILATDTSRDDEIAQAIVAGEYAIDVFCGRGFPDIPDGATQMGGFWDTTRPSLQAIPPAVGELNIDAAGTAWEINKQDTDGLVFTVDPIPGQLMIADWPIITGNSWFTIDAVVDQTTYWELTVTPFAGVITPPTMDAVRVGVSTFEPSNVITDLITVVPAGVSDAALSMAIAIWKEADSPSGTAGGDAFFGPISVSESTRQALERNPMLVSFRVSWGIA